MTRTTQPAPEPFDEPFALFASFAAKKLCQKAKSYNLVTQKAQKMTELFPWRLFVLFVPFVADPLHWPPESTRSKMALQEPPCM